MIIKYYSIQTFPGTANAGNITLRDHSTTYHFRVSASVLVGPIFNEGDLSAISDSCALFVPKPGNHNSHELSYLVLLYAFNYS